MGVDLSRNLGFLGQQRTLGSPVFPGPLSLCLWHGDVPWDLSPLGLLPPCSCHVYNVRAQSVHFDSVPPPQISRNPPEFLTIFSPLRSASLTLGTNSLAIC